MTKDKLDSEQMEMAFRHGFDARTRFADRPFNEVESLLRESWEGKGGTPAWERVSSIVRGGYERYKGAPLQTSTDLGPEALDGFRTRDGDVTPS